MLSARWQQVLVPSLRIRAFARQRVRTENWQEPFFRVLQTPRKQAGTPDQLWSTWARRQELEVSPGQNCSWVRARRWRGAEAIEWLQLSNYLSTALQWLLARAIHTKNVKKKKKFNPPSLLQKPAQPFPFPAKRLLCISVSLPYPPHPPFNTYLLLHAWEFPCPQTHAEQFCSPRVQLRSSACQLFCQNTTGSGKLFPLPIVQLCRQRKTLLTETNTALLATCAWP